MIEKYKFQRGFTLIELLASTFVIVVIGGILVGIIVSTLRGSNKTNNMATTRQNGTYTLSQVAKLIRFANEVTAIDGGDPSVCITNKPFPTPQPTLTPHYSITFDSIDGGSTTIECKKFNELTPAPSPTPRVNEPMTIASNGASLLDTTMVQIPSGQCQITCDQSTSSDAMLVGFKFSLTTLQSSSSFLPEFMASASAIEFKTSVVLRNITR